MIAASSTGAEVAVLTDGTPIEIRPITVADVADLVDFHEGLSAETIHRRFFGAHPHLTAGESTHFCTLSESGRFAIVALAERRIIGVARMECGTTPDAAEVAFVVADRFQHRGLGRLLAVRLAAAARSRGITTLEADVLSDNSAMLRLLPEAGMPVTITHSHGVARLLCVLPDADAAVVAVGDA